MLSGLTPLTVYHYRVVATNAVGTTYGRDRTFRTTVVPPSVSGDPGITGTPRAGSALTCAPGSWTGAASFAFAWLRDGSPLAAGSTYTPVRGRRRARAPVPRHRDQRRRRDGGDQRPGRRDRRTGGVLRRADAARPDGRPREDVARRRRLQARHGQRVHANVKRGRVLRSTPRAHKVRAAGTRVSVVVSRGPRG